MLFLLKAPGRPCHVAASPRADDQRLGFGQRFGFPCGRGASEATGRAKFFSRRLLASAKTEGEPKRGVPARYSQSAKPQ